MVLFDFLLLAQRSNGVTCCDSIGSLATAAATRELHVRLAWPCQQDKKILSAARETTNLVDQILSCLLHLNRGNFSDSKEPKFLRSQPA